jgi:hypothetical protein
MAHYAHVIGGTVTQVHVVANEVITDDEGVEQESLGQSFLANLWGYDPAELVQCSYNGNMRGVYPGPGYTYDETLDAFIPPQPYPSWVLDEATCWWVAPIAYPTDGATYTWDEQAGDWIVAEA